MVGKMNTPQANEASAEGITIAVRQLLQKGERSAAVVLYARQKSVSVRAATAVIDDLIQQIRGGE